MKQQNISQETYLEQQHPYPPFVPAGSRGLILGSAPPFRFCLPGDKPLHAKDMDYYYGSHSNLFWDILFRVFEPDSLYLLKQTRELPAALPNRTNRQTAFLQDFLVRHNLAIADILERFERMGSSAADYKLKVLQYNEIIPLLSCHESIGQVFCTSRNRVFFWLQNYLKSCSQKGLVMLSEKGSSFQLISGDKGKTSRTISIKILPSPSARGIMRFANKEQFLVETTQLYHEMFRQIAETS